MNDKQVYGTISVVILEILVSSYCNMTQCHNPEDLDLNHHHHENLKSHIYVCCIRKSLGKSHNVKLTTGFSAGDLARTIGSANEDTTKPIVINIASSYAAVLLEPVFSV
jgi:hypothetical protein